MSVLALDLATTTGFAILRDDSRIESGTARFTSKAKEGRGARWLHFKHWLIDMKNQRGVSEIVYEEVMGHGPGQVLAAHVHGGFLAHLEAFCEHHAIPLKGFSVAKIKKAWTGKGNARKGEMVARAIALGFKPKDHNEADAIALLHLATKHIPDLVRT